LTSVAFDVSAWVVVAIVSSSSLSLSATGVGAFGVGGEPESFLYEDKILNHY
jgi:hypothetical protein